MIEIILLVLVAIFLFYLYASRNYDYWKNRNVPYVKPKPFVGNILDACLYKHHIGEVFAKLYNAFDNTPYVGIFIFDKPALLLRDPDLAKKILIEDFSSFTDRIILKADYEPENAHMIFIEKGDDWRIMRNKVKPVFSNLKLKTMCEHIDKIAISMADYVENECPKGNLDAKELISRYATALVSRCGFGFVTDPFGDEETDFQKIEKQLFDFSLTNILRLHVHFFFQSVAKLFRIKLFDPKPIEYLREIFWDGIEAREKGNVKGNDLLDLIVDLRKNREFCETMKFEGDKVIAQALMFFTAGSESSTATLSLALYELALHPEIQRKLREEIQSSIIANEGKITYETLSEMKYLTMVIKETLRNRPVFTFLDRVCNKNYQIPETNLTIETGIPVIIPVMGFHKNPDLYENPDDFNPERFRDDNRNDCTYLAFGKGPRTCIGERLGYLSVKLGLVRILSRFQVVKCEETPDPLIYEPKNFLLSSKTGLRLKFEKL